MGEIYDAVVIGGGHNGLVTGFYLARAGMRCVVLERRDILGGACNTEEFAPGYRASTGAYVLSMLRDAIWRDMRLVRRGVHVFLDNFGTARHIVVAKLYIHDVNGSNKIKDLSLIHI